MTLRKITIDDSAKFIPQSEQNQNFSAEGDSETDIMKNFSLPRKQHKKVSQTRRKILQKYELNVSKTLNDEQRIVTFI